MSEQLDLDAIEARERAAILPDEEPAMADMNEEILALIAELRKLRESSERLLDLNFGFMEQNRKLREENATACALLERAAIQLSKLTGEPWPPLPAPPEVGVEGRDMCVSHEDGIACGRPEADHCEKKEIGSYWCGIRCEKAHHDFEPPPEVKVP